MELTTGNLDEFASFAQVSATPFEAMDRLMRLASARVTDITGKTSVYPESDYPLIGVANATEFNHILGQLTNRRLAQTHEREGYTEFTLTLDGWQEADRLRRVSPNSNQAFVAMAFAEELRPIFTDGIAPALEATGYAPFRVDQRLHNDKIDDRIVAEIRQSGLLVADFTTQRTGVYWEAGFAQGLGIPVIRTCRKDDLKHLHFDTRQYLHVEWTTEAELRDKLEHNIRATIPGRAAAQRRARGAGE